MKNLNIAIHLNRNGEYTPFAMKFVEILKHNHIPFDKLSVNDRQFWLKIYQFSHFIFHWGGSPDSNLLARSFMPVIENSLKIPVFPDFKTTWHHDDKIRQYYLLNNNGFPMIDSWIFWEKQYAMEWLKNEATFPLVFKLKSSAGSQDVVLVKNFHHAKSITKRIFGSGILLGHIPGNLSIRIKDFKVKKLIDQVVKKTYRRIKGRDVNIQWQREKNYVLFQQFLPQNQYDTRITIIGDRAFAFRRFNRDNDFRSSGSGRINYDMNEIDSEFLNLAFQISTHFGFQSMAYDFLWNNGKPAICEMSYTYLDSAIYNCPGYFDRELIFHEGHFWPQLFILKDLLKIDDLEPPPYSTMAPHQNKTIFNYFHQNK